MSLEQKENELDVTSYKQMAKELSSILEKRANSIDKNATFPKENLEYLKETGIMGMLVPKEYEGVGASISDISDVAQILAGSCLSTSIIWAMHCQQVATLINHADSKLKERILPGIAQGSFIASVTSEYKKGGHLLTANSPLEIQNEQFYMNRKAPIVTGGAYGDYYLITMRSDEKSKKNDVKLILVHSKEAEINIEKLNWDSLGMRGTQSVSLDLKAYIDSSQLVNKNEDFQAVAQRTMIPVGHIVWVSCWLGATKSIFRRTLNFIRDPKTRPKTINLRSELFLERLARIRIKIDVVDTYLKTSISEYEKYFLNFSASISNQENRSFNIHINNLKIIGSEQLYQAATEIIDLIGSNDIGALKDELMYIQRTLRDLRSASLMYNNYRLLIANGQLALLNTNLT